jgi:hypothetical protein
MALGATPILSLRRPDQKSNGFPHVSTRGAGKRREAYLLETRLAVWEVAWLERVYGGDAKAVSQHLQIPKQLVMEALAYAQSHPEEIDSAIHAVESSRPEQLTQVLPTLRVMDSEAPKSSKP